MLGQAAVAAQSRRRHTGGSVPSRTTINDWILAGRGWRRSDMTATVTARLCPFVDLRSSGPSTTAVVRTLCYTADVSENVSVRLEDSLAQRLRLRARAAGETLSDRLRRYADEGVRRDEHPLITFRDGPTGRRAGLVGGPDVWEVAMWIDDLAAQPDPIDVLVKESVLTRPQIEAALRYRAAYPEEIDARIELHRRETASASRS